MESSIQLINSPIETIRQDFSEKIELFLKKEEHVADKIIDFLKNFQKQNPTNKILDILSKLLDTKKIYYIRHAESTYNE